MKYIALTTLFIFAYAQNHNVEQDRLPQILRYDEPRVERDFVPLKPMKRLRRGVVDDSDDADPSWTGTLPPDVVVQNDTADHQYYVVNTYTGMSDQLKKYWVDIDRMLEKKGVVGNRSHPLLSKSYRRAVGSKISFQFPFYGHRMNNLTIATGGFIYIGDQTHNWLAATQYIAPLMANFHTYLNDSNIIYADDGSMFVVEWRKVQLREDASNNTFSFQVILHKNGDIVFAYKDVPLDVSNISDANHPVKLGISDAYLFQHTTDAAGSGQPKRVIYEYHRIEVPPNRISANTVVVLQAQPTCIFIDSCEACSNSTLKYFKCSWCHSSKKNGGPFCTDEAGLHRRRQQWVTGNCRDKSSSLYCDNSGDESEEDKTTDSPDAVVPLPDKKEKDNGGSSSSIIFLLVASAIIFVAWLAYAYYNPHTTSGQLLIRYRPSRWHVPNSHVRYSASVHM